MTGMISSNESKHGLWYRSLSISPSTRSILPKYATRSSNVIVSILHNRAKIWLILALLYWTLTGKKVVVMTNIAVSSKK